MTISSITSRISYAGNDVTTAFSFPYKFLLEADLVVKIRTVSTGVEVTKTLTTHYTTSGAGGASGGTVTMLTAPATGQTLVIYDDPARTQSLDLVENDSLPAESVEGAIDRNTLQVQRLSDRVDRAVRMTEAAPTTFDPQLPALTVAGANLQVNSGGTAFSYATPTTLQATSGPNTDNSFPRWDGTNGTTLQSGQTVESDAGVVTVVNLIDSGLTATTVPYANASKQLTSSAVTPTELGYISGLTSSAQTQITALSTAFYNAVVASSGGTHTTLASAISAVSAGQIIYVRPGTYTENITLSKVVRITGAGRGAVLSGTFTFASGSSLAQVDNIKITGTVTVNSGVASTRMVDVWMGTTNGYTDNSGLLSNYYEGMEE